MTYAAAREKYFETLRALGWDVRRGSQVDGRLLKIPHATSPDGKIRLWFKPQALWVSYGVLTECKRFADSDGVAKLSHDLGAARSTWLDIRRVHPLEAIRLCRPKET